MRVLKIKVSSKRQATFPKQVCESLGIQPGDEIFLDRRVESDEEVWVLKASKGLDRPWLGSLRKFGHGKSHDMEEIRGSIAKGRRIQES